MLSGGGGGAPAHARRRRRGSAWRGRPRPGRAGGGGRASMSSPEEARAAPAPAPAGELPPEWEADEERMAFLFSAFKQSRDVNATDWDSKMRFWAALVLGRGGGGGGVRTSLRQLQRAFERRGSVPLGLGTVLRELLRRGKLQRESDFMASVDSSWISWGVGTFILKPLKWTLSSVLGDGKVPEEEEVLIYVELLQEKADEVYHLYHSSALSSHPVVGLSELRSLCAGICPDERTFCLVLLQLQKEKRVTVLEQNGNKIMKFARGLHAKVSPMNDVDIGVYQLMQSEQLLSRKVESLSQEAERCKEEARSACRAGKKQVALRCLKSKRRTERRITELHSKLDVVQGILDRIYASQTDQMVFLYLCVQTHSLALALLAVFNPALDIFSLKIYLMLKMPLFTVVLNEF
ncbi:hypothetical protein lerEdw1_008794 [Lerista edwardsae]|nr:hypothetical protein lerEdw1_008794 [Lerista edwardsae]